MTSRALVVYRDPGFRMGPGYGRKSRVNEAIAHPQQDSEASTSNPSGPDPQQPPIEEQHTRGVGFLVIAACILLVLVLFGVSTCAILSEQDGSVKAPEQVSEESSATIRHVTISAVPGAWSRIAVPKTHCALWDVGAFDVRLYDKDGSFADFRSGSKKFAEERKKRKQYPAIAFRPLAEPTTIIIDLYPRNHPECRHA